MVGGSGSSDFVLRYSVETEGAGTRNIALPSAASMSHKYRMQVIRMFPGEQGGELEAYLHGVKAPPSRDYLGSGRVKFEAGAKLLCDAIRVA